MEIKVVRSSELSARLWESYAQSFNVVFQKDFSTDFFNHKYLNTIDHSSYHALLIEKDEVVGGCSIIPYNYLFRGENIKIGLAVDVFILPSHRSDPYTLLKMYTSLKKQLIEDNVAMIVAVPNDLVYPYWKNIVKWKDIGTIPFNACPVKLGNVLNSGNTLLNFSSRSLVKLNIGFNAIVSYIFHPTHKVFSISVDRSNPIVEKQRYTPDHFIIKTDLHSFAYRITEENKVQTAYLIDFYNKKHLKDLETLLFALKHIIKHHQIDLLLFVGKLQFFQTLLIKIPFSKEPKHLFFMGDIINPINNNKFGTLYDYKNWDFGLFNYDVR